VTKKRTMEIKLTNVIPIIGSALDCSRTISKKSVLYVTVWLVLGYRDC